MWSIFCGYCTRDSNTPDSRHDALGRLFERSILQKMVIALITGHTRLKTSQRYANQRTGIQPPSIEQIERELGNSE
jgi:hypothetical protein